MEGNMGEVYTFIVNGQKIETSQDKNLLDFLRDDLGLISVKMVVKKVPVVLVQYS